MRWRRRITAALFWGGAVALVPGLVAWGAGAAWKPHTYINPATSITLGPGEVFVHRNRDIPTEVAEIRREILTDAPIWRWRPSVSANNGTVYVHAPYWMFIALAALAFGAGAVLRRQTARRDRAGLCPQCHYNRTGLALTAPCPECGAAAPALPAARS